MGGGGQKNRQQVRSQLQRSEKPVFASSQVLGRGGLNHSFGVFWGVFFDLIIYFYII